MSQLAICLIIFVLTVAGYCSSIWSLATVSITSLMALVLTGCLEVDKGLSYFAKDSVIMIAGMCIVAAGFNRTRFCTDLAERISKLAKGSITKMMLGYVIVGVILSQFIQSPVVVFGIVAPLALASTEAFGLKPSKTMFPLGIAIIVTCCILPVGAGATVPAELNGYLESYGYTDFVVGQLDPMLGRLPMLITAIVYFGFFAIRFAPDEPAAAVSTGGRRQAQKEPLKPFQEKAAIAIFFLDALALMFTGTLGLETWQVTVLGALAMIWFGVLKPKEASGAIPLSMLLLIVGTQAMAGALSATGAGDLVGGYLASLMDTVGGNSYIMGFVFFIIPFILTQFMSNRATMMIFHPIAIATCAATGGNPVGLMILIQAACLSAFATPMATQAVPLIMGYGGYDQKSMLKQAPIIMLLSCVVNVGWIMTVFPIK